MGNKKSREKANATAAAMPELKTQPHSIATTQTAAIAIAKQEIERERKQRLASTLAEALTRLSLDLIGICVDYIGFSYPAAIKDAKPQLLSSGFTSPEGGFHDGCYCIAISPDDHVWVSSFEKVQVFTANGEFLFRAGERHSIMDVRSIAFCNNEVFLGDRNRILICGLDGSFVHHFASLCFPTGVVALDNGLFLVYSYSQGRIYVVRRDTTILREIEIARRVRYFLNIALTSNGDAVLGDYDGQCIKVFARVTELSSGLQDDGQGIVARQFGRKPGAGQLDTPGMVTVDSADNILVSDPKNSRVVVFDANGEFLTEFGQFGSVGTFGRRDSIAICVDSAGRIFMGDSAGVKVFAFE